MPARVYILAAESPDKLVPTFQPAPGRPTHCVQQIMSLDEFRRLDGPAFAELLGTIDNGLTQIRRGALR